jgi:TPR repeat protein
MTATLPEPVFINQDVLNEPRSATSYYSLDFETLSVNPPLVEEEEEEQTQQQMIRDATPENVTQSGEEFTKSNIIQKPDDVVPPPQKQQQQMAVPPRSSSNTSNNGMSDGSNNSIPTTNSSPRIMDNQQKSPSFSNNRIIHNNNSPSFQQARLPLQQQNPHMTQHNGIPMQPQMRPMMNNNGYLNNANISRQPSTFYSGVGERPPPPPPPNQQQFPYRQGAPLQPQSQQMIPMSPQKQFMRPPPPPPPTNGYYNPQQFTPQMRPMMNAPLPPPPPQSFGHNASTVSLAPTVVDNNYLADSSLSVANSAGKKSKKSQFPPATKENLAMFREEAKNNSNNPQIQLDFAKFLLEAANQLLMDEQDAKRSKKVREAMIMEAQKIVKKLAAHSGMGKQGFAEAQFFLANCYGTGSMGLQTDPEKAFALYVQGSKQNHPGCTFRAAVCYEVGAGTKRDKNHAMQFYRKAANLGDNVAMYKLGMILLKGFLGQPKNPREGISWLKRASQQADEDHPHALHELGLAFEKEGIPSVIPDLNYARELFTQAAQYGYAPSQFKLGLAYENGFLNCPVDPRRSIAWYSKAAEQGDVEAEFALSGWYLTGAEGVLPQSDSEAYLWARKAADRGNAKAEYAVGYYTETGTGVRQNLEEAKRWYMRAAAQNYRRAMQRLTELKYGGASPQNKRKHTREGNNTSSNSKDGDCSIM